MILRRRRIFVLSSSEVPVVMASLLALYESLNDFPDLDNDLENLEHDVTKLLTRFNDYILEDLDD